MRIKNLWGWLGAIAVTLLGGEGGGAKEVLALSAVSNTFFIKKELSKFINVCFFFGLVVYFDNHPSPPHQQPRTNNVLTPLVNDIV